MAQQPGEFAALPEDPSSVPRHISWRTTAVTAALGI